MVIIAAVVVLSSPAIESSSRTAITGSIRGASSHHYTTLRYTTLHYNTLYYITLHYTTPHYTTIHYTTIHYTTLHYITPVSYTHLTLPTKRIV